VLSFSHLSNTYCAFAFALSYVSVSISYHEALLNPGCKRVKDEEMATLHHNETWDLTILLEAGRWLSVGLCCEVLS